MQAMPLPRWYPHLLPVADACTSSSPVNQVHSAKMSAIDRTVTQHDTATRQTVSMCEHSPFSLVLLTLVSK